MLELGPMPKVITFDCCGTLVQWHRAVQEAALAILSRHLGQEVAPDQAAALAVRLREAAVTHHQGVPFRPYRSVLQASLDESLAEAEHAATPDDREKLLSIPCRIAPHPEVAAALDRRRASYRLAIISNTDDDLIAGTVAAIGTPVDFVVTAQQAQAYKPDHRLFLHAHAAMG